MSDDGELLRRFVERRDEASFEAVVNRYLGFVYAVSLRRLRDIHTAKDAAQAVFIALARKADVVAQGPSVMGWLHKAACYETRNLMRAQRNRIVRESEAARLGTASAEMAKDVFEPVLDEALGELSSADREAILARYFSNQSYAQIGARLRLTENAARMRVDRAVSKLRSCLERKGITSTAAVLTAALPSYASTTVPAGVAVSMAKAAVAAAGSAGVIGPLIFMSTAKIALGSAAAILLLGGVSYRQHQRTQELEARVVSMKTARDTAEERIRSLQQQIQVLKDLSEAAQPVALASATTVLAQPLSTTTTPRVIPVAPPGWQKNGSANDQYEAGVDETQPWGGMPSAYVKSIGPVEGKFGGMMQSVPAENYKGRRMQLSGWIKTEDVERGAHLWMRVDGKDANPGKSVAFDNMHGRAPKGTTDWEEYTVVLEVPEEATRLNYGFFVAGPGKMWVNGVTITPVGENVPVTDLKLKKPTNLGFTPAK